MPAGWADRRLDTQDMGASKRYPDKFETVPYDEYDQEGVPDWAEPIEPQNCRREGDDGEDSPAETCDDAVCFAAAREVCEAVGTVSTEVQSGQVQTGWANRSRNEEHTQCDWNRPATSENCRRETHIAVHSPLPRVHGSGRRRCTRPSNTGPLLEPRVDSALCHANENR
jgi:hypothetical protein